MSRRWAAASTVVRSPASSAAASRSSARTSAGAASTPRAYARSTRLEIGTGRHHAPPRGRRAGSIPRSRAAAPGSCGKSPPPGLRRARGRSASTPASPSPRGPVPAPAAGQVARRRDPRATRRAPPGSSQPPRPASRRPANSKASSDGASSQWASSTHSQHRALGRCEQQQTKSRRSHEKAVALHGRSQAKRATQRIALRTGQIREDSAAPVARVSSTPAKATSVSPGMPLARNTLKPSARSAAKSSSADLPAPGTPRNNSTAPPPARVAPISDSRRCTLRLAAQEHPASVASCTFDGVVQS